MNLSKQLNLSVYYSISIADKRLHLVIYYDGLAYMIVTCLSGIASVTEQAEVPHNNSSSMHFKTGGAVPAEFLPFIKTVMNFL